MRERDAAAHGPGHALERLLFFSDAVFAIAITLLVIEIHVPHVPLPATDLQFLVALAPLAPSFAGFFISFFVIGAFWAGHHRAFDCARHWDPGIVLPNLMMLSAIAALPFFTAFSAAYYGQRVPVALYTGWMLVIALLNIRVQRLATAPPIVGEHVGEAQRTMIRQRGAAVALGAGTAFLLSLIFPPLGQAGLASIYFWRLIIQRVQR